MDLGEFIFDFARNHKVVHIDDEDWEGVVVSPVSDVCYLVRCGDVRL